MVMAVVFAEGPIAASLKVKATGLLPGVVFSGRKKRTMDLRRMITGTSPTEEKVYDNLCNLI